MSDGIKAAAEAEERYEYLCQKFGAPVLGWSHKNRTTQERNLEAREAGFRNAEEYSKYRIEEDRKYEIKRKKEQRLFDHKKLVAWPWFFEKMKDLGIIIDIPRAPQDYHVDIHIHDIYEAFVNSKKKRKNVRNKKS